MNIIFQEDGQVLTMKLKGEIDHHSASESKKHIDEKLEIGKVKHLVVDMKGINFIDSSAIGFIIGRYKVVKKRNGSVSIVNASRKIKKILDMSGIGKIINIK